MIRDNKTLSILFMMLFYIQSVSAQGHLSGTILNKKTGQPIPDANIMVLNTRLGTVSRDGGFYTLDNLPYGKYQIQFSVIGFASVVKDISLPEDKILYVELEPKAIEYDPVVVTATLSEHRQSNVTVSVDVLTKNRIKELDGNTAGEIIRSVGGVYSNTYDGLAGLNTPSIRGSQAAQVVVLMDGVRLNTVQGGGVDLNIIPLAAIERVEIIKGGHSAILGSDAIGGAINLITNDVISLKGYHYGVNSTLGSFGTQIHTIEGSHQVGPVALFAGYNRTQSDGDFKYIAPSGRLEKRINNDTKTDNFFLKGSLKINDRNNLQVFYHQLYTKRGIAGDVNNSPWTGLPQTTPEARSDVKSNTVKIEASNQLTNRLLLKEQAGYHTYDYHYINPEGLFSVDALHENSSLSIGLQGIYKVDSHMTAIIGINYQKDDLTTTSYSKVDGRMIRSVFGQLELKHALMMTRWTWIPAVRWDGYSDIGSNTSPKLGIMVNFAENNTFALKGNIGKSYRVPTFDDLYWPESGNPDLLPETGTDFDIGLQFSDYQNGFFQMEVTYFNNHIKDLISWQPGADYLWHPTNLGKADVSGLESGLKFRLPSDIAYVNVYYTKMKATDETKNSMNKGKRLIYRPDNKWDILVGSKLGPMKFNLNYRIVSKSYTAANNSEWLNGYQILNANIRTDVTVSGFQFSVRLQCINLTDKKIFLNDGYPLPGREYRFTLGIDY